MFRSSAVALISVISLSACSQLDDYNAPSAALPVGFANASGGSVGNTADLAWWTAFQDATLDRLTRTGLSSNLDIQIAQERFGAARAIAAGAGVATVGGITGTGGVRGDSDDDPSTESFASGDLGVSWLVDFFGELRGIRAVAAADMAAAGYDTGTARLAFLSELTTAYIDLRFYQNSLALERRNLASRRETIALTERLLQSGEATVIDTSRATVLVEETLAEIPALEAQFAASAHRIATLLGKPAGTYTASLTPGAPQPLPRRTYRAGVPADLIRNRPDVRAAERRLAAATARTGVAKAQLFPSISLTGRITGTTSSRNGDVATWAFGPVVRLPIFGRERLNASVSAREAEARAALLTWQKAVLVAVEEVENALVRLSRQRAVVAAQQRALRSAEEALRLAQESYGRGERLLLDVLDAERRAADARLRFAAANRTLAREFVALNVAIGAGRWVGSTEPATGASASES